MKTIFKLSAITLFILFFSSCKKDEDNAKKPNKDNQTDHGFITKVMLTMEREGDTSKLYFVFSDKDGPGGLPPQIIDTIQLPSGTVWNVTTTFWDESNSSEKIDITSQIEKDSKNHILCFEPSNANIQIERTDSDGTFEIGLKSRWRILEKESGSVLVTLKHQVGIKDGTCLPGSTDAAVRFPFVIID
jgi:hypothetical protein